MGRDDYVIELEQWILSGGRFLLEHIQRRAGDALVGQRFVKRRFIDDRPARGVPDALYQPEGRVEDRAGGHVP